MDTLFKIIDGMFNFREICFGFEADYGWTTGCLARLRFASNGLWVVGLTP